MGLLDNKILFIAGIASLGIAVLHIVFIIIGPAAYRYFGAGENMARMAEEGSLYPPFMTFIVAGVFAVFALYAFSGVNLLIPLPLLRPALFLIGSIYSARGLAAIYFLYILLTNPRPDTVKDLVFSLVSLTVGVLYLLGWVASRQQEV